MIRQAANMRETETMTDKISRREFVLTGAAAGLAATVVSTAKAAAPAVHTGASRPVVVSSFNGFTIKNGGAAKARGTQAWKPCDAYGKTRSKSVS